MAVLIILIPVNSIVPVFGHCQRSSTCFETVVYQIGIGCIIANIQIFQFFFRQTALTVFLEFLFQGIDITPSVFIILRNRLRI